MNKLIAGVLATVALVASSGAFAEDIVSKVENGCKAEIEAYCSNVTMGEGRMLACFYAHEDTLSGKCPSALYDASAQLERAVSALNYVASQCDNDITQHCAGVQVGEGEILECLRSNSAEISGGCKQAMADVIE